MNHFHFPSQIRLAESTDLKFCIEIHGRQTKESRGKAKGEIEKIKKEKMMRTEEATSDMERETEN